MSDWSNGCAVITGGGSGIGAALARHAATLGMNVVLADIAVEEAQAVADEIGVDRAIALRCDVSSEADVTALADAAEARFGRVGLLCNNAGIVPGGRHRRVWEYTDNDWQWSLSVNLGGVLNGMRVFVPRLLAAEAPAHIMNTASVAGLVSGSGSACYGAAKHAVVRATEALYAGLQEMAAPIGVTLLLPGLVATRIYDAERSRPQALAGPGGPPSESAALEAMRDDLYRGALTAEQTATIAFDAIRQNRFYATTTDAFDAAIRARADAILSRTNPHFESIVDMSRKDAGLAATSAG